jgi:O-glycosyl hydrolase
MMALTAALWVEGAAATRQAAPAAEVGTAVVDLRATEQRIDGFGTSSRVWSDPHLAEAPTVTVPVAAQRQILTALYGRLGLTRVRALIDQGVQEKPDAPFRFGGKLSDSHIAFIKQAKSFGLRSYFPAPVYLEDWMRPDDPDAYVDWAMAVLRHWRAQGAEPPLFGPLNEPQIARDFPPQWLHDVVIRLGKRLRAAGFKTKLVIPDDENPSDAYRRAVAVLSDPSSRQYVGALAYHVYKWDMADIVRMRRLAAQHGLPIWMTEWTIPRTRDWDSSFQWAERMHTLLTNGKVNAIDYMWGYFGDWVGTDTMVSIKFENGAYRGHSFTPIYWLTGHYSRYVRPGFVRIGARVSSSGLLVSAYKTQRRLVIVVLNPLGRTERVRMSIRGGAIRNGLTAVRSSANEQWRTLARVRPVGGSFTATLPPRSIVTYAADR